MRIITAVTRVWLWHFRCHNYVINPSEAHTRVCEWQSITIRRLTSVSLVAQKFVYMRHRDSKSPVAQKFVYVWHRGTESLVYRSLCIYMWYRGSKRHVYRRLHTIYVTQGFKMPCSAEVCAYVTQGIGDRNRTNIRF